MTSPSAPRSRLLELDALRGIAALLVVFYHYTARYAELYPVHLSASWMFEWGKYGVHLFFMISGFVIFMTLSRTQRGSDFVVARFARLYPAYWTAVLLTSVVVHASDLPGRTYPWWVTWVNLTMIQNWLGVPSIDGVYWSLSLELSFYGWIWLALVMGWFRHIWASCFVAALLAFVIVWAEQQGWYRVYWPFRPVLLIGYAHLFLAGMAFYRLHQEGWDKVPSAWFLIGMSLASEFLLGSLKSGIAVLVCTGVFVALIRGHLAFLTCRPLVFMGALSYSLYLVHQNVGYAVIRKLVSVSVSEPLLLIGVPLSISVAAAYAIHVLIEEPVGRQIRQWWRAR